MRSHFISFEMEIMRIVSLTKNVFKFYVSYAFWKCPNKMSEPSPPPFLKSWMVLNSLFSHTDKLIECNLTNMSE